MHERAIEERITLTEDQNVVAATQVQKASGPMVIKGRQGGVVFRTVKAQFGRDRILHRVFGRFGVQKTFDDAAGLARPSGLAEMGNLASRLHKAMGANAHQFGVAGAKAGADDASFAGVGHAIPSARQGR